MPEAILGMVIIMFIGFVIYHSRKEFKDPTLKFLYCLLILYIFLGGYGNSRHTLDIVGFLAGTFFYGISGGFLIPYQIGEAILLALGINEPTHWPNLFIEGPKAHFDLR